MTKQRVVVVGGGMTAQHFLERLVADEGAEAFDLTLLTDETHPPYDRVHLGSVLEGRPPAELVLRDPEWHAAHGIALLRKQRVVEIDRPACRVLTDTGMDVPFDTLVLATGGAPFLPPIKGVDRPGVVPYRDMDDVENIASASRGGARVVVAGGGLLGLEAAEALARRGCQVDVIEAAPRLLPRQLDTEGAGLLAERLQQTRLGIRTLTRIVRIESRGEALCVHLDKRGPIEADIVVVATGVRPRDAIARDAGLQCHPAGGILVDDTLATSDPKIHAIGECVRHRDVVAGFVSPCYAMAETLAARLRGERRVYLGATPSASLKIPDVDVVSVGEPLEDGIGVSALTWNDAGHYRRVVLRSGRIIGALAVGPCPEFSRLQEAVARGARVYGWQRARFARSGDLWRADTPKPITEWADAAVVCTCTGVTCGALRAACASGCATRAALSAHTGAGSVCGSCEPLLDALAGEESAGMRTPAGSSLGAAAALGLALVAVAWFAGPVSMPDSVEEGLSFGVLWRDAWWKELSGFTLVGLSIASLGLSLRKRWKAIRFGTFGSWRLLHSVLGVATIVALGVHTGYRLGANLNAVLMICFSLLVALGSCAALVTSLEHRLPPGPAAALRRGWTAAHVFAFWPLPVLTTFHVLAVYLY